MPGPIGEHGRTADPHERDRAGEEGREQRLDGGLNGTGNAQPDPALQATEQARNQASDRTNRDTEENNRRLDKAIDGHPEDDFHAGEEGSISNDPIASKNKISKLNFEQKAKTITDAYCEKMAPDYANSPPLLRDKASVITAENAELLLNNPAYNEFVGVLDLRDPNKWDNDLYDQKIPGALEFPMAEVANEQMFRFGEPMAFIQYDANRAANWQAELQRPGSPFPALALKPVVIIHCRQSSNRTPMFASGYLRYVALPRGQKVVLLKGGFEEYQIKAKLEHIDNRPHP